MAEKRELFFSAVHSHPDKASRFRSPDLRFSLYDHCNLCNDHLLETQGTAGVF